MAGKESATVPRAAYERQLLRLPTELVEIVLL